MNAGAKTKRAVGDSLAMFIARRTKTGEDANEALENSVKKS